MGEFVKLVLVVWRRRVALVRVRLLGRELEPRPDRGGDLGLGEGLEVVLAHVLLVVINLFGVGMSPSNSVPPNHPTTSDDIRQL